MEIFNSPVSFNSGILISEISQIGFVDVTINNINTIVKDAVIENRPAIQAVLDAHNPNLLSAKEQAKSDLSALDLSGPISALNQQKAIKDIIVVLRTNGFLEPS